MKRFEVVLSAEDLTCHHRGYDHMDELTCRACKLKDALNILPKRELSTGEQLDDAAAYVEEQLEEYPLPNLRDLCEDGDAHLREEFRNVLQTILSKLRAKKKIPSVKKEEGKKKRKTR